MNYLSGRWWEWIIVNILDNFFLRSNLNSNMRTYKIGLGVTLAAFVWAGISWYFHQSFVWPSILACIAAVFFVYDRVDESKCNVSYARIVMLHEKLMGNKQKPRPDLGQYRSDATNFCVAVLDHVRKWSAKEPRMNQYCQLCAQLSKDLWDYHYPK